MKWCYSSYHLVTHQIIRIRTFSSDTIPIMQWNADDNCSAQYYEYCSWLCL